MHPSLESEMHERQKRGEGRRNGEKENEKGEYLDTFLFCVHIANKRIVHMISSARQWRLSNLDLLDVSAAFLLLHFYSRRAFFILLHACVNLFICFMRWVIIEFLVIISLYGVHELHSFLMRVYVRQREDNRYPSGIKVKVIRNK